DVKPARNPHVSMFSVSGSPPLLHDLQDVPHGTVHSHNYYSKVLGAFRFIEVYTPPHYEVCTDIYPTLYLIPGSGDTHHTWVAVRRVHCILDNLIAGGLAIPMVVATVDGEARALRTPRTKGNLNTEALRRDLIEEVLPFIHGIYRVREDADHRALFGVSRGGG